MKTAVLIVQFSGDPREHGLHRAYLDACRTVEDYRAVSIIDSTELVMRRDLADQPLALQIRAFLAVSPLDAEIQRAIVSDHQAQLQEQHVSLGISPAGPQAQPAVDEIRTLIGDGPPGAFRWIIASQDVDRLRSLIVEWLLLVIDRRLGSAGSFGWESAWTTSVEDDSSELDSSASIRHNPNIFWGIP